MKAMPKGWLLGCFTSEDRACAGAAEDKDDKRAQEQAKAEMGCVTSGDRARAAIVDEEQRALERAQAAREALALEERYRHLEELSEQRVKEAQDMEQVSKELEQLIPGISGHRSRWQRVKDALRWPAGGAKVRPVLRYEDELVTVDMMSPLLRKFLGIDDGWIPRCMQNTDV